MTDLDELAHIRHDLRNLRYVMEDYHFPRKVREAVAVRIEELERQRRILYERQFHIPLPLDEG